MFGVMSGNASLVLGFLVSLSCFLSCCQHQTNEDQDQAYQGLTIDQKITSITKEINNDRLNPNLFHKRASLHLENKNLYGALNDITVAIKIDSTIASQYHTLSEIYSAKKEF